MEITRILNNNAIEAIRDGRPLVAMGKGLAFGYKVGDELPAARAEKIFELSDSPDSGHFKQLLQEIPPEYFGFILEAYELCEKRLGKKLEPRFCLSLLDHVYIAVKRAEEGTVIPGLFSLDARRFYRAEYDIACELVGKMEQRFGVTFD